MVAQFIFIGLLRLVLALRSSTENTEHGENAKPRTKTSSFYDVVVGCNKIVQLRYIDVTVKMRKKYVNLCGRV